ncbi:MAG: triphosphoribosyl-dephospho-CoA synthase [Burkholderiales bacterium]
MLNPQQIVQAYLEACRLDVEALKPGNVSTASPGHGMVAEEFLKSAQVSAVIMAEPGLTVGQRILGAVQATHKAVGCNTNLGIVLLCAPLAQAALRGEPLSLVLEALDEHDAQAAYEAICLASPAGLGRVPEHDVHQAPAVTLLQAMQAAAQRDRIAYQYASAFEDVYGMGVTQLRGALAAGTSKPWAMTGVFLAFASAFPDSHIARKYGVSVAEQVRAEALAQACAMKGGPPEANLKQWDQSLKARGLNPGTSADLSVATWFALALEHSLK